MTRQNPDMIDFYNRQIIPQIEEKYGYTFMQAVNEFVNSKTHKMLEDEEYGLAGFASGAVFDMWECEKVTGRPQNSIYIRGE